MDLLITNHSDRHSIQHERSPERLRELFEQYACQTVPELRAAGDLAQSVYLFAKERQLFQVEKENCPPTHTQTTPATPRRTRTASAPGRRIQVGAYLSPKTPKGASISTPWSSKESDAQPIIPTCPENRRNAALFATTKPSSLPSSPTRKSWILFYNLEPTPPSITAQPPHTLKGLASPQAPRSATKRICGSPPIPPFSYPPSKRNKVYHQAYLVKATGLSSANVLSDLLENVAYSTHDNAEKQPAREEIVFSEVVGDRSTAQRHGSSASPSTSTKEIVGWKLVEPRTKSKPADAVSTSDERERRVEHTRKAVKNMITAKRHFLYARMNIFDMTTDRIPLPPRTGRVEREDGEGAIEYLARRGLF